MGKKSKRQLLYELNKTLKVKEECTCPVCRTVFVKKQWAQAFCSNQCKNDFWNGKKDRHSKHYYDIYNSKHPSRLDRLKTFTTDRQKRAVRFCERVLNIEFLGDINNPTDCSHFLNLFLENAKVEEYYCPMGSDESFD